MVRTSDAGLAWLNLASYVADLAEGIGLVAIDIDGTLLRSSGGLAKRTVNVIREVSALGVHVVLATARPPRAVREIYDCLGLDTPLINYNGAMIYDPPTRRRWFHQPLDPTLARRMVGLARRIDRDVVVNIEILDKWYTDRVEDQLSIATTRTASPDALGPLNAFLRVPVTKLMFSAPAERLAKVHRAIQRKFGRQIAIAVSDSHMIQVLHRDIDKSCALAILAAKFGLCPGQTMAIGDAPNDVGMLRWAGLGVAVKNAWLETRHAADVVVPSNDEDGVAVAIQKYILDGWASRRSWLASAKTQRIA